MKNDLDDQIKDMVRETSTDLYNAGHISKKRYEYMMKLTAKDDDLNPPRENEK